MKKKFFLYSLLAFLTVFAFHSCKKGFLDTSSFDGSINDATAFQQKADYVNALVGTYASLHGGNVGGDLWVSVPGWVSQDWVDASFSPKPIGSFMSPGNNDFLNYWTNLYKVVTSANLVLDKLATAPAGMFTDAEKASMTAQAKFLRGWAYFSIARAFGDVPMPLTFYKPEQNAISCTPKADVFKQVVKDLSEAAAGLPEADDWSNADRGRATKGGALAYLANAHMYLQDWPNAAKATIDLFALTKPKYELGPSVRTAFSVLNKNTPAYRKENIFEVQYREKAGDNFRWGDNPNTGHLLAGLTAPRNVGDRWASWGGWGEFMINKKAVDAYNPTDERRTELVKVHGESYKGELMATTMEAADWAPNNQKNVGFSTKYWLGNDGGSLSPQNLPMMRFSEVLLNYAEILFNQNNTNGAYEQLNKVRQRAKVPDLPVQTNNAAFMTDLMNERRFELLFEPNLWFHYTRTGTAAQFLQSNYGVAWQDKWKHFPIPERERSVNPNLCSNGY